MQQEFKNRLNAFQKERTFVLDKDRLQVWEAGMQIKDVPLRNIKSIKLSYEPTRLNTRNYVCTLDIGPEALKLQSTDYVSLANFRDNAEAYVAFVSQLLPMAQNANPYLKLKGGSSATQYYGSLAFLAIVLVLVILVFTLTGGFSWTSMLRLVILAIFIPSLLKYIKKNKPIQFSAYEIPEKLLPIPAVI